MGDERNDEERIIENMLIDGHVALYEDLDFLSTRQSLYNSEKMIPEYDDENFQRIQYVIRMIYNASFTTYSYVSPMFYC